MRRILVALAMSALAAVSIAAVPAGEDTDGHGDGHGGHGTETSTRHGKGGHEANTPVSPGARKIKVAGTAFKFAPKQITIQAGEDVAIVLSSKDVFHDFMVQGVGHVVGAKKGRTRSGGLMIDEPGTYKFWCSISGHRSAGMKGTIVVD